MLKPDKGFALELGADLQALPAGNSVFWEATGLNDFESFSANVLEMLSGILAGK